MSVNEMFKAFFFNTLYTNTNINLSASFWKIKRQFSRPQLPLIFQACDADSDKVEISDGHFTDKHVNIVFNE